MVRGVYLGLEQRLTKHLKDPRHAPLLKRILEWQSEGGPREVEERLREMVEGILGPGDEDA